MWLLYCIPERREEKGVATETYQKPSDEEEEGHPPVMHQTIASYAPRIASKTCSKDTSNISTRKEMM
jgi:hypothetical protein